VVSYLGYETIIYKLNTLNYTKPLVFALQEKENVLDEIIIKKTVYDDEWKYNLRRFRKALIGITKLSKECEILNAKTLHFEFDTKKQVLTAFNRKPLQIKHKGLGYLITFDLVDFQIHNKYISYAGYSRYQLLKGSKKKQKRWKKERLKTYLGSHMHFYRSAIKNKIYDEGFIVNQFKRVPNKERPTEKEIIRARNIIRNNRSILNFTKKIDTPKNSLDSALVVVRKSRLPKYKDLLYKRRVEQNEIISVKDSINYLEFENNLMVIYTKEKEEIEYVRSRFFGKNKTPQVQTSSIVPIERPSAIDKNGILYSPLDVLYEGYWSYEKLANSLPVDYEPPKD